MPRKTLTIEHVDRYELATILAALRLFQAAPVLPEAIAEIATEEGDFKRLDNEAIDELCERLNHVAEFPFLDISDEGTAE